ncbi:RagB/SusD family nutrient uptake outer membrane protein [Maribacter ulvicola]|uniref:Starch-binding associating with outer membrane n=1 Tax=Maribacter ulvicola TaxID=228959 RepID=A0A1N6YA56_9FLAO|nr:RagB/SusD family nutrient uptake outer membrane protein [Maribacter ulvicola]SIR11454.1 Starch-binding associating with outer membrane [Maribacter ulvicola]
MTKKIKILPLLAVFLFSACQDYLDIVPNDIPTINDAFINRTSAETFLFTIYSGIEKPADIFNSADKMAGDEVWVSGTGDEFSGIQIAQGLQSVTTPLLDKWQVTYRHIRNCNVLLANIDNVPDMTEFEKKIWKAEAKALKAYYHFILMRQYGPITISDDLVPVSQSTESQDLSQRPIDEVVDYIVTTLDEAMVDLPDGLINRSTELGRISGTVAAAIKARVLVTAASPLFNGNIFYSGFVNKKGEELFSTSFDPKKWEVARDACKEAIEMAESNGYQLYNETEYKNLFVNASQTTIDKMTLRSRLTDEWNKEILWGRYDGTHNIQFNATPQLPGTLGSNIIGSRLSPTLRIAEMYYTNNGVPIDEDPSFDFENRYKTKNASEEESYKIQDGQETAYLNFDREIRFYADLGFDRSIWSGNGKGDDDNDPFIINARSFETSGRKSGNNYSATGYFPKKLVKENSALVNNGANYVTREYAFPIIRLADLYLYYAETLNETKAVPDQQVYEYIDRIRNRAKLDGVVNSWTNHSTNPGKITTQEGMRQIIQQERMIELAFEGARFWDLRRWKLSKEYLNRPIRGWNTAGESASDYYTVTSLFVPLFFEKDYLWPIREQEIINNPDLVQNPGW